MAGDRLVLPARPLRLQGGFVAKCWWKALSIGGIGVLVIAATLAWVGWVALDIVTQARLEKSGKAASMVSIDGKVKSTNFLLHEHDLTVRFDGHTHPMSFTTLFLKADRELEPQVWYDPNDPSRFALNLATGRAGSRVLLLLLAGAMFGGIGLVIVLAGRAWLGRLRDARTVAAASDEVRVTIVRVEELRDRKGAPTGERRFHWQGQDPSGKALSGAVEFPRERTPFFADAREHTAIALYAAAPPGSTIVLRDDLYPFAFEDAERARIRGGIFSES